MRLLNRSIMFTALALVFLAVGNLPLYGAVTGVWAVNDGEKIFRYQGDSPLKQKNSVWDGGTVRLKGLYNEVLAFQVIVEADSFGASAVEIAVEPPVNKGSGRVIGSPGQALYSPSGAIDVFSEHYIRVRRPTKPQWFYGSEASAPKRMTGWIPDALIPPDARAGRGGFPIDIPRARQETRRRQRTLEVIPTPVTQNQGFWIDVYLPRDKSYPAGLYEGKVRVYEAGRAVAELKLEITLLPHYLPDENHANIWLYGSLGVVNDYYPELSREEVERMLKFESHRHRIDFVGGSGAHRSPFDQQMMDDYKPYLDGSAFTPENGYHGPGQGSGERLFTVGCYGSITNRAMTDEQSARRESDLWVKWFEANAPEVTYFWYMIDEPGEIQFPWIKERADWIHNNPGPGKRLPVFTTREHTGQLDDYLDIWAGGKGVHLEALPELKAKGKDHWFYNGRRPRYGAVILEADAVDFRVNAWVKYLYEINTWFLWEGTLWQHNMQGPKGHLHQRVFTEPLTFISWSMSWANGDGIVFYPGRMPFYPEEDRGLNRLLGSIRLKNMRRGRQDYEIMWLAEQKVGREKVLEIIRSVVPKGLNEVDVKDPVPWSEHGDDYDLAREKLLDLLGD
ncbi:glycoside hydrolase domain-containing protein [Gemmatimonadota bacterium]